MLNGSNWSVQGTFDAQGAFSEHMRVEHGGLKFVLGLRQSVSSAYPPKAQPRILGFPLLAFISPAPWIGFVGLPFAAYYFIGVRHSASAALFFAVIGALILVWLVGSVFLIRHFRKRFRQNQSQ